jgi:hypothetical protein
LDIDLDEKWDQVMDLAERIGDVLDGEPYDVVINTLIYMLANGGAQSELSRHEFLATMYEHIGVLYDRFKKGEDDGSSEIQ